VSGVREASGGLIVHAVRRANWRCTVRLAAIVALGLSCGPTLSAQTRRPTGRAPAPPSARHWPVKAIFEPVTYAADVEFDDVFFVDKETGWACGHHGTEAGEGGFLIATHDGGTTWTLQLGDPRSSTRAFVRLFFLDATHGWATQAGGRLLRTTDGSRWEPLGDVEIADPFVFVAPEQGFFLDGRGHIQRTVDGGRTWQSVYQCRAAVAVQGVTREQDCQPEAIAFAPDRMNGAVVTRALDDRASAVITTADGGATWTETARIPETDGQHASLVFTDTATGFLRVDRRLKMTADGGGSWHDVAATVPSGNPKILFAGGMGWIMAGNDFSYTTDSGRRWLTRTIPFPASVVGFSVPAEDVGYVVGHRGMVYRYRVVPFDYAVPNMLVIPPMSGLGTGGDR